MNQTRSAHDATLPLNRAWTQALSPRPGESHAGATAEARNKARAERLAANRATTCNQCSDQQASLLISCKNLSDAFPDTTGRNGGEANGLVVRTWQLSYGFFLSAVLSFASSLGDSCCTLRTLPLMASTFTSSIPLLPSVLTSNEKISLPFSSSISAETIFPFGTFACAVAVAASTVILAFWSKPGFSSFIVTFCAYAGAARIIMVKAKVIVGRFMGSPSAISVRSASIVVLTCSTLKAS